MRNTEQMIRIKLCVLDKGHTVHLCNFLVDFKSNRRRKFLFENGVKSPEAVTVENGKTYNHIYHYCLIVFVLNSQFHNLQ